MGLDFRDAALVLLGHGTVLNADSAAPVYQHAAALRQRQLFAGVHEAFWKQEPRVDAIIHSLTNPRIFIMPLFISEGYFSEEVIPRELGFTKSADSASSRVMQRDNQMLFYCKPVGTHPMMSELLLKRSRDVLQKFPFPRSPAPSETTLVIVGHGTEKNQKSREAIERQQQALRDRNLYAAVHSVFLDEEPRVPACYDLAQTRNIVVVPFFMSDGLHTQEDIPVLLGEAQRIVKERLKSSQPPWRNPTEKKGKLVWYAPAIGSDPAVADIVLERVREAASELQNPKFEI